MLLTLFQWVPGYQPTMFPWNTNPTDSPTIDNRYRQSEQALESTHWHLEQDDLWTKQFAVCWLFVGERPHKNLIKYGCSKRTSGAHRGIRSLIGPKKFPQQVDKLTCTLDLSCHWSPPFHVSHLKPVIPGHLATNIPTTTPSLIINGSSVLFSTNVTKKVD